MFHPKYIQLPKCVLQDNKLQDSDKILYGYIYVLARNNKKIPGACTASNESLSKLSGKHERSIGRSLSRLDELGHIKRTFFDKAQRHRKAIYPQVVNR